MRFAVILLTMIAATACGQTGSLYLPDESVETPVEIRTPATPPPAPAPADEDEEKKDTHPPGG